MSYNKPCVFGCNTKGVTVHRFPNYNKFPKRFQEWIKSAGDAITHLSYEYIQEDMRVCDRHFTESMKNRNKRLNTLAVPTLHLPVPEASQHQPDIENRVPPSTTPEVVEQFFIVDTPSTSKEYAPDNDGMASESNILRDITNVMAIDTGGNPVELQQTCLEIEPEGVSTNTSIHSMKQGIFYKMGRKGHLRHIPSNNVETRTHIRSLNNEIRRLRKRSMSYKTRLEKATKMSSQNAFQIISKNMSVASKIFTSMQYTQGGKKPKGRRFTLEEKILALTLYKRSPKAYALLYKYFTLPAGRSLKNLLAKIKIKPGINELIFEKIKETVSQMTETEKLCSLIFDEMALTPQIHFMSSSDEFKGFISYGKEDRLADKALVFMIKGLTKNYKQPVAYYFTENLNRFDLKQLIKNVINNVQATGLRVICTICDQSAVNVSAINSLISDSKITFIKKGMEWRHNMFYVNKCGIIPLYDVPHLLKGVRNNLLNKDIHFIDAKDGNKVKVVKFEYFRNIYEADQTFGELRMLHAITEEHIIPDKIKKMKVKLAAQLFSHSMAVAAEHLSFRNKIPQECRDAIPFLLLIDKLFDSLNCDSFQIKRGKIYRAAVKQNSPHHQLWAEALIFLKNLKFVSTKHIGDKIRIVESSVPTIINFIKTIEGMQNIWQKLHNQYHVDTLLTRNFNQDPVENFFGNIRSLGVRNVSPNALAFEGAFKTLLLNNFGSSHSLGANCEEDLNKCLQSYDFFLNVKVTSDSMASSNAASPVENIVIDSIITDVVEEGSSQREYVCGWVLKKCLAKIVKGCVLCKSTLLQNKSEGTYTSRKEYCQNKTWLCYPSDELIKCFNEVQNVVVGFLKQNNSPHEIKKKIRIFTEMLVFYPFKCDKHKMLLKDYFEDKVINVLVYSWCKSINRILGGKIKYQGDDLMKTAAQHYFNKHKKK